MKKIQLPQVYKTQKHQLLLEPKKIINGTLHEEDELKL
jgi:hypothetical protein